MRKPIIAITMGDAAGIGPEIVVKSLADPALGDAAVHYTREAARLALAGEIDGIVSAPLNKEAMRAAGHHYEGATEIFAEMAGVKRYAMVLLLGEMRLLLLTNHMSLRDACDKVTQARVYEKIVLAHEALVEQGIPAPRIAVSALNPHAGEGGLFGREEIGRASCRERVCNDV